jgi:DNA-3-methyladenine glycosylase II
VIFIGGPVARGPPRDRFGMLVRSILAQQISGSAARTIRSRLFELIDNQVEPHRLLALTPGQFKSAGVSPQKTAYLLDLSDRVARGELRLAQMGRYSDEAVVEHLLKVKGIGRWTAQMFLIFSLGRLDVLPHDDVGIQNALQKLYRLAARPDRETIERIAEAWRPFATVACWYCWRSLDTLPS